LNHPGIQRLLPSFVRRFVLHFEAVIETSLARFASDLAPSALVLDAGAGESLHAPYFQRQRYVGLDLAVGDPRWNYSRLDVVGDLTALPFHSGSFDACINIVTLEHVREPALALREIHGALKGGGRLLLIVPHEWEVHQSPHDYFRYTRHGIAYLLQQAGFEDFTIQPVGGYFRLLSRRLLNGMQFFPGPLVFVAAIFLVPPALLLPFFDPLDQRRDFTLGYVCMARKTDRAVTIRDR
jgi:SAM-dependent methyltransferase